MHRYLAYCLGFHSEIRLPELLVASREVDVEIKCRNLEISLQSFTNDKECFWANESEVYRSYENIGSFHICQGREIIIDPAPGADEQLLRQYLLGNIFGALLHQRGLLVLHGSAIAMNGKAVAFLGPSGSGKSTSSAFMNANGYAIVADDLVAIDSNGSVPVVYPAFPQIKLWPDVAESLGYDLNTLPYVVHRENKRIARLTSGFSQDPLPLSRIYLLEKGELIKIMRLGQRQSTIELVSNSYAVKSLNAGVNLSSHFLQCTNVAKNVPISRLVRPFDLKSLPDFACAVEDDMASR